jgi:D-alanyl-D-alanine-carboxypeptidase/D-alanyl-D-alanine-endopeptidase
MAKPITHAMMGCALGLTLLTAVASTAFASDVLPPAQTRFAAGYPEVDRLVREFLVRENVPGGAWGIIVDGKLVHVGVHGLRDVASGDPVTPDSVFRIASMTKSFTALAILQLRDAGKLALDDPAEKYIPEMRRWRYPSSDAPKVTIRDLLTHSGGFPEDNPWGDQQLAISEDEFTTLLRTGMPFSNAPGVAFEYSNYGYALLGRIVSRVSRLSYPIYVERNILKPLGMTSTTLEPRAVDPQRLALGYRFEDGQWKLEPQLGDGAFGAMGGMLTSLDDLGRYVGEFLAAFPPRDGVSGAAVARASLREMQQMWRLRPVTVTLNAAGQPQLNVAGYGYGLRISQTCDHAHVVAHSGGLPGFGSQMRWLPDYGVGLIALGNRTYTPWGGVLDQALLALARTGSLTPRAIVPSAELQAARAGVERLVGRWNDDDAQQLAAMNLFLDRSLERRRAQFAQLSNEVGECRSRPGYVAMENPLRGDWLFDCERGSLRASITLSPTLPPKVQHLELRRGSSRDERPLPICQFAPE